jgi:hypothetical protein
MQRKIRKKFRTFVLIYAEKTA